MTSPSHATSTPPNRRLQIDYVDQASIRLNPRNPRRHSRAQIRKLARAIEAFGMNVPILVDAEGMIIAGEGRFLALAELGWTTVPVIRLDHLSQREALAFLVADNKLAELSEFDRHALGGIFRELALEVDLDLELTGFEVGEIDLLVHGMDNPGPEDPADAVPEPGPAVSRPGDLWLMRSPGSPNQHKLLCGSALEPGSYAVLMDGKRAAACVTDPPYGGTIAGYLPGKAHREFVMGSEGRGPEELEALLQPLCVLLRHNVSPGALAFIFMDWRGIETLLRVGRAVLGEVKNLIVWAKSTGGMGSLYRSQHELIALFKAPGANHRNNVQLGRMGRYRTNVWTYAGMNSPDQRRSEDGNLLALHPTVKPVAMIADAILDCTAPRDIVLDPFLGSGTTLLAAERVGRRCHGIELDPLYVDCAIRRWQRMTGEPAIHLASGQCFDAIAREREAGHVG